MDNSFLKIYKDSSIDIVLPHRIAPVSIITDCSISGHSEFIESKNGMWRDVEYIDSVFLVVTPAIEEAIEDMWKKYDICNRFGKWVVDELNDMTCYIYITYKGKKMNCYGCLIKSYVDGVASFSPSAFSKQ